MDIGTTRTSVDDGSTVPTASAEQSSTQSAPRSGKRWPPRPAESAATGATRFLIIVRDNLRGSINYARPKTYMKTVNELLTDVWSQRQIERP